MIRYLERFFDMDSLETSVSREVIAGLTTFVTMAYIIVVNPKILEAAGIPFGPGMVATILTAFFGSMAMGLYAKRPFAVAPYMGENAFVAFTVVKVMGYSWQTALGAVFLGGLVFLLITVLGVRQKLVEAIPAGMKRAFAVGIGLFLTFIGLSTTGLVQLGIPGAPVAFGNLHETKTLLAVVGFLLIVALMIWRVKGSIILGILVVTGIAYATGSADLPDKVFSAPPSLGPVLFELDIAGACIWGLFSVILTIFVMDFVDTMGSIYAVSSRAGFLDEDGNIKDVRKPLLVDAVTTMLAALLGTSTSGVFIESATGIEAGGRSGLTAVVTGLMFLLALFLAPFFISIPACAYGPSLIVVGMLMMGSMKDMEFNEVSDVVPAFLVIVLMSFTYNIGIGMTAGFAVYPFVKAASGRISEVTVGMWALAAMSLAFFVFYPH